MRISIELSEVQAERLRSTAERLGVRPEELARAGVTDMLARQEEDFVRAADHVLRKNAELYRRLA